MERLYQMHVIPELLPVLQPTVDLRVVFPEAPLKNVVLRAREEDRTSRSLRLLCEQGGICVC